MLYYPAGHDQTKLSKDEIDLKIARHSECNLCNCRGLHPPEGVAIVLDDDGENGAQDDPNWILLRDCDCGHALEEHGLSGDLPLEERDRRGRAAIRLDELLQDINKLLDFEYHSEDIDGLRKQMKPYVPPSTPTEPLSSPSSTSPLTPDGQMSRQPTSSPRRSLSSFSDEEEDQPLARRIPSSSNAPRTAKKNKKKQLDDDGQAPGVLVSGDLEMIKPNYPDERPPPHQLEKLVTAVAVDTGSALSAKPEKPCVAELRKGIIRVVPVASDGDPQSLIILTGLKTLFQKQLPKMPREYISRLVYDHNSRALAIVKSGWKVVGGILFRPFAHRGFAEIVFFATASIDQIKGYGGMLMNHFKAHIKKTYTDMTHFLTYADNYAVGYFKKQGFSKDITLDRSVWAGYIKDYEGATILECAVLQKVDYIQTREILSSQREAVLSRIKQKLRSHVVHPGLTVLCDAAGQIDPKDVPGLRESGWNFSMAKIPVTSHVHPDQAIMQQILSALQNHPQSWAFLQPVNGEEVTDYYDVVKKPMDFNTMEHKLTHNLYETIACFVEDARLVFSNCLLYNPEGSVYAKNATKMEKFLNDQLALFAPHAANTMP